MKAFDLATNKRSLARGMLLLHLVPVLQHQAGIGLFTVKGVVAATRAEWK